MRGLQMLARGHWRREIGPRVGGGRESDAMGGGRGGDVDTA